MSRYTTVGGYPNTDPYYISPEEEAEMERPCPHTVWLMQECRHCGKIRRDHIWTTICPDGPNDPTRWFSEVISPEEKPHG